MKSLVPVVCFALAACCAPAMAASLTTAPFGTTRDGKAVTITTMAARDGLTVRFIGYGGRITQILAPDRQGHLADIVLGYPTLAQYRGGAPDRHPVRAARARRRHAVRLPHPAYDRLAHPRRRPAASLGARL